MKLKTIIGLVAVGATATYLLMPKKEDEQTLSGITLNPNKLLNGALAMTNINPIVKEGIRQVADRAINKYMGIDE